MKELQFSSGAKFHKGVRSVDKNEAKTEGLPKSHPIEQGLLTFTLVRSSPDEDKEVVLEILKEANRKVEEQVLLYGRAEVAASAIDQAQSGDDGSIETSSTCEEEETSYEEDDPLVGVEIQDEADASEI
ncbi:hypothetical protein U1Q18_032761 [Sarracenia purpurea var. burkii]